MNRGSSLKAKTNIPTLVRGFALNLCYSIATFFLGLSLAFAAFFAMYPDHGNPLRPLIFSGIFLSVVLLGWVLMPMNRPPAGTLVLQVLMMWSLLTAVEIVGVHLHGQPIRAHEWIALGVCAVSFALGIYVSRRTRWGRKRFIRGSSRG
jgi:ABC-type amino acid transport system permease subunit